MRFSAWPDVAVLLAQAQVKQLISMQDAKNAASHSARLSWQALAGSAVCAATVAVLMGAAVWHLRQQYTARRQVGELMCAHITAVLA